MKRNTTASLRKHVDIYGVVTTVTKKGEHIVVGWSKRRVGVWRDDRQNRERLLYQLIAVVDLNAYSVVENCVLNGQWLYVLTKHGWLHAINLDQFVEVPEKLKTKPKKVDASAWGPAKGDLKAPQPSSASASDPPPVVVRVGNG